MGKAFAQRLSKENQLFLYDVHFENAEHLAHGGYGEACKNVEDVLKNAELIILAVKPQSLKHAAELMKDSLREGHVIVSILAGTPLEALREHFSTAHLVRMMPNLALVYGEGVIGLCAEEKVKKEEMNKAFEALGKVYWLPEEKMDALTALTGSGPAFFLMMIEAMIDAGIAMGFTAKDAQELVRQMLQGSLTLLEKTHKHPGELKWQIASPQGTTIAGLRKFEELAIRGGIINTFLAAYERARDIASQSKNEK